LKIPNLTHLLNAHPKLIKSTIANLAAFAKFTNLTHLLKAQIIVLKLQILCTS